MSHNLRARCESLNEKISPDNRELATFSGSIHHFQTREMKQDKTGQKTGYQKQERKNNKTQNRTLLTGFDEVDYQSISL